MVNARLGWYVVLLNLALLAFLPVGCTPPTPTAKLPPMPVTVAKPLVRDVAESVYFTGRTDGSQYVEIRSRVSGYLDDIHFSPGKPIEKDAPLFDIDRRPYQVAVEQAVGDLERMKARAARTTLDLERAKVLVEKRGISQEEYDRYVADQAEANAALKSAEAAVDRAKLDLSWTKITSPIAGIVSREMITRGNLVQADQTLLTTVLCADPIYVYYDIDERTVLRILKLIREGKFKSARENRVPIQMALGDDTDYPHEGYINFVENKLDPKTGTMRIRGTFENPTLNNGAPRLAAGLFARVRLQLEPPQPKLLITERAILSDQSQKFVYVVNDKNEVDRRDVELGVLENGLRVINAGLQATDQVVINGVQRVRPGVTVTPKLVPQPERIVNKGPASGGVASSESPAPATAASETKPVPATEPSATAVEKTEAPASEAPASEGK